MNDDIININDNDIIIIIINVMIIINNDIINDMIMINVCEK